jgi:hypothetical protein
MNEITFTIYKSTGSLSKRCWLDGTQVKKQASAQMTKGSAERVTMAFADFPQALANATDKQAFGYGTHDLCYPDKVKIAVSGQEKPEQNIIPRTLKFYTYHKLPGLIMFDHDPNKYGKPMTPELLLAALCLICPSIKQAARIIRGSVSAGVHLEGELPRTDKGFHIYFPVINAADIPRFGKVLGDRLWLTGHGFIALSACGSLLPRTCIDAAVFSAERLDFVGNPIISGIGLMYTPPKIIYTDGGMLDTESLPDLTDYEQAQVDQLKAEAKAAIKPESAQKQKEWSETKINTMTAAGVPFEKAREVVEQILKGDCKNLYDDFILEFATGEKASVSDVLADPKSYDGKPLADPIEGKDYGATTAKFYWNKGKPFINSMAHGGCKYLLHDSTRKAARDWEAELDAHVEKMNETHASVVVGKKHRIMRAIEGIATLDGRDSYEFFTRYDLDLLYDNTFIQTGFNRSGDPIYKNHLISWATNKNARTYKGGVIFLPGRDAPVNYFNTWQGFSVEPQQNDVVLELVYAHLSNVVCAGHRYLYDYLIQWIAYTFQNPDKPAGAAIVLRGLKGSGKGTIGHFLRLIWGNHGLHISSPKHLIGNFNAHLADVCFFYADEAFFSGDRQHEGILKALITEPVLMIERKGIDAVQQPNFLKIFMTTNADYAVPATKDERRYCVIDVSSARIGDRVYFNDLHKVCASKEVQSAFLYNMLNMDLSDFHIGDIPDSAGLRAQRYHSLNSVGKWLVDCLKKGCFGEDTGIGSFPTEICSSDLYKYYLNWCNDVRAGEYKRETQTMWGRYLGSIFEKGRANAGRTTYYFGNLDEARALFEAHEKINLEELNPSDCS